jgi:predicted CoA-substrate-specific enzyme activase
MKVGIDLGSRAVKIAIKNKDQFITHIFDTVTFYRNLSNNRIDFLKRIGLDKKHFITSTGYGRYQMPFKDTRVISEIIAHVKGAVYQTGLKNFVLLDIGGQDTKTVLVENSRPLDFKTNDKCAASTGRFIENMSQVLEMTPQEVGLFYKNPVPISSTCAIFAESEIVGLISEGVKLSNIAAGINYSIFNRIKPLLNAFNPKTVVFAGGVAGFPALSKIIEKEMKVKIVIPEFYQLNAAIGCAVHE